MWRKELALKNLNRPGWLLPSLAVALAMALAAPLTAPLTAQDAPAGDSSTAADTSASGDNSTGKERSNGAGSSGGVALIFGIAGWVIGAVLLGLSFVAAYLMFDQIMHLRRDDILPPGLSDRVREHLAAGRVAQAATAASASSSLLGAVLTAGVAEVTTTWADVEKAVEDALHQQAARLFRKLEYLSVIGNIAPMVGLLGTVTGMVLAFMQVADTEGSAGAADLAQGIYTALYTTVGGLIVAIASLGAFAVFRNRTDQFVADAAHEAQMVFSPLKRRRGVKSQALKPPPAGDPAS